MAEITGQIKGAYREEGFILDNDGNPVSLVDILNMILTGGADVNANNGLNVFENEVRLGGALIEDTVIETNNFYLKVGEDNVDSKSFFVQDSAGKNFYINNVDETFKSVIQAFTGIINMYVEEDLTDFAGFCNVSTISAFIGLGTYGDPLDTGFSAFPTYIKLSGVRTYANDAAAQADVTLPVDGIYRLNADPVLRIKI